MNTKIDPPQPRIGVAAIIFDDRGKVLLIRRDKPPARGQWSIPGGCQEAEETLAECAVREVLEETGIEIILGPIVAVTERIMEGFHYVIIDFLATARRAGNSAPLAATDVSQARWVDLSELDNFDTVIGLSAIIRRINQIQSKHDNLGLSAVDKGLSDFLATR